MADKEYDLHMAKLRAESRTNTMKISNSKCALNSLEPKLSMSL
jgi:hypothetical protein